MGLFRTLLGSLTGTPPARPVFSTTATSGSRYQSPPRASLQLRELRVVEVVPETPDAVTLRLEPVGPEPLGYRAGQFLTFVLRHRGDELRRAYSLSSSPLDPGALSLTVKRVPGGRVSGHLHDEVRAGAVLSVLGPSGEFTIEHAADFAGRRSFVFIAGGSGITPIFSLATTLLRREPNVDITLLYGNRRIEDIIFRDRLSELSRQHPNFHLRHVLEEPPAGGAPLEIAAIGRLTGERVLELTGDLAGRDFYLCGPEAMIDGAAAALRGAGAAAARIHTERFTAFRRAPQRPTSSHPIHFARSGRTAQPRPGQTVLEAGLAAGVPLAHSCGMGGCAACKVKVVHGTVVMDEPNCLSQAEREGGWVLACVACAATPIEVDA